MGAKREPKAREATPDEILTALTLEARRRGLKSYGELQTQINWVDQQEIVNAYIALKDARKKERELRRSGCDDNGNIRNLAGRKRQKGNTRSIGSKAKCTVSTADCKPLCHVPHGVSERRLMEEDWSDKTIPEIAAELGIKSKSVYSAIYRIKSKYYRKIEYVPKKGVQDYG